jgi:hypothetical protein
MSILEKLTEGIVDRDLAKEGAALQAKWERTGLLEGIADDRKRAGMSRLLENQAKELLREASSMGAGDVQGFAAVAFPIVRRVFGGLLANDIVSVQPMSLPSGLIFFLDFTYTDARGHMAGVAAGESLYGGGIVAAQLTGGVTDLTERGGGFYNYANAYSSPTGSLALSRQTDVAAGDIADNEINAHVTDQLFSNGTDGTTIANLSDLQKAAIRYDADIMSLQDTTDEIFVVIVRLSAARMALVNKDMLGACSITAADGVGAAEELYGIASSTTLRRLTHLGYRDSNGDIQGKANHISFYVHATTAGAAAVSAATVYLRHSLVDNFDAADTLGAVQGADPWGLEGAGNTSAAAFDGMQKDLIPEIDIKVDSVAVTAITKKLKAKWTPELGQDLNAYHNLDAEVELTSILSEQIALEIDREIVNDLIKGATAGTYYWSRAPGLFVNRTTGVEVGATSAAPDFTGTVSEWYETLIETVNDLSATIHRKTLRGGANFLVTSPEVASILEFTSGFRASVTVDGDRGTVGAVKTGSMSKKWDIYVDPYFPRNVILVGRRGGSFLESGYVYAPYVPLQVTPTIFGTEDFVPRKGVMTRYAKKMVRPDMYGLVVVRGLLGESGS